MAECNMKDFEEAFNKHATKGDGSKKKATCSDVTKWFKAVNVFGKNFTSNHLDICWAKFATVKEGKILNFETFSTKVLDLCLDKYKVDAKCADNAEAKTKLISCLCKKVEQKGISTANKGTTDRLTDASKYTGAHKERFDADGKGKGIEGRENKVDNKGYVGNYKGEGTYEKK